MACVVIQGLTEPAETFYWPPYLLPQKEKCDEDESEKEEEEEEEEEEEVEPEQSEGPQHTVSSEPTHSFLHIY